MGRDISGTTFFLEPRYIEDDFFFMADRSLGAKQEGPTIVHFYIN